MVAKKKKKIVLNVLKNIQGKNSCQKIVLNAFKKYLRGKIVTYLLICNFMLFMCFFCACKISS